MKSNLLREHKTIFICLMTVTLLTFLAIFNNQSVKTEDVKEKSDESELMITLKAPTQFTADTVAFLENEIKLLISKNTVTAVESSQVTQPQTDVPQSEVSQINQTVVATVSTPVSYQYNTPVSSSSGIVLANGNTAGEIGTAAAARMAAATGVPQQTWEYIIARESNGNPNVANPSGASGLFQTMPGWGSTATVDDQINAALNAYNNQGLAAWGMQ